MSPEYSGLNLYVQVICLSLLCFTFLNYASLITLLTTRRLMQPLKIRLYPLLMYHYFCEWALSGIGLSRLILSPGNFPCWIYRASIYVFGPGVFMPWVLNGLRIWFVFQVGRVKENYRRSNSGVVASSLRKVSSGNLDTMDEHANLETKSSPHQDKDASGSIFDAPLPAAASNNEASSYDTAPFNSFGGFSDSSPFGASTDVSEYSSSVPTTSKKKIPNLAAAEDHLSRFLGEKHLFVRMSNILFNKWVIIAFILVETFITGLLFLCDMVIYQDNKNCDRTFFGNLWSTVFLVVHFSLMIITVIAQRNIKERFMLKWENRLITLGMVIFCFFLILWTFLPPVVSYYFPTVWFMFAFFTYDSILSGWIPTLLTLRSTYGFQWMEDASTFDPTKIKNLMLNSIMRSYFMDFCQQEFSLENPNFWLDIHYFRTVPASSRPYIAKQIIETYFKNGSALELNIPNSLRKEYLAKMTAIQSGAAAKDRRSRSGSVHSGRSRRSTRASTRERNSPLTYAHRKERLEQSDFFDEALVAVENNMLDTFSRFIHNEKYGEMIRELESQNQRLKNFNAL